MKCYKVMTCLMLRLRVTWCDTNSSSGTKKWKIQVALWTTTPRVAEGIKMCEKKDMNKHNVCYIGLFLSKCLHRTRKRLKDRKQCEFKALFTSHRLFCIVPCPLQFCCWGGTVIWVPLEVYFPMPPASYNSAAVVRTVILSAAWSLLLNVPCLL
jgi:hypothetical protein